MNIETCTVQLTDTDIKGLRLMAALYLETSSHEIQKKVPDLHKAENMDAASVLAHEIIEQL